MVHSVLSSEPNVKKWAEKAELEQNPEEAIAFYPLHLLKYILPQTRE